MNPVPPIKNEKNTMKLVIVLIIVIVMALLLNIKNKKEMDSIDSEIDQKQSEIKANDASVKILQTQGTGDEINDIEKDLNATNVEVLTQ